MSIGRKCGDPKTLDNRPGRERLKSPDSGSVRQNVIDSVDVGSGLQSQFRGHGVGSAARSEDQAARHTTPAVIAAAETSRFHVKGSLRKTIPMIVANRIDVSRRPDTRAICSPDIAHTTMP